MGVTNAIHNRNLFTTDDISRLTNVVGEDVEGAVEGDEMPADDVQRLLLVQLVSGEIQDQLGLMGAAKLWANATVKYCYAADVSHKLKSLFEVAVNAIERAVPCMKFESLGTASMGSNGPRNAKMCGSDPGPAIFVQSTKAGCWSYVGAIKNWKAQPLNLAEPGCFSLGIFIHEIGHAIGMQHEHVRPDASGHIMIKWRNIAPSKRKFFKPKSTAYTGEAYDYKSVMHYSANAFKSKKAKKWQKKLKAKGIKRKVMTIKTKQGKWDTIIGQRVGFSQGDADQLAAMYKSEKSECEAADLNGKTGC